MKKFKSKTNLIISIIALIECIVLLGLSTYSWIESASSLRIANQESKPLTIADAINYEYVAQTDSYKTVDLGTYFSQTSHFRFAQASSADGKNMYFARQDDSYRVGDTTDYNTCYYNFDFKVNNSDNSNVLYFFESQDIFTLKDSSITTTEGTEVAQEDIIKFLGAFRIAITAGDIETTTPVIYSKSGTNTTAMSTSTATATQSAEAFSAHLYNMNDNETQKNTKKVFDCAAKTSKNINIKIWFECKDSEYLNLSNDVKKALLGAPININLNFSNSSSSYKSLTFNDYTMTAIDSDDTDNSMYFYGNGDVYPMTTIEADNSDCISWITCDEEGNASSTVPDDAVKLLFKENHGCYFFYGTVKADGTPDAAYSWVPPIVSNNTNYIYNSISVTNTAADSFECIGTWDSVFKIQFVDKTTYCGDKAYNSDAYQFLSVDHLYVNFIGLTTTPIKMIDTDNDHVYTAYLSDVDRTSKQICFYYTPDAYYNNNAAVTWTASASSEAEPKYTAVGYNDENQLSNLNSGVDGVGTWLDTKRYYFSTELIDYEALADTKHYCRVFLGGTTYIHMTSDSSDPLLLYAEVPTDIVPNQYLYYSGTNAPTAFNPYTDSAMLKYDTYYATSLSNRTGVFNAVVLVDGTADNLVNYTLDAENLATTNANLQYKINNESTYVNNMTQLDNYRFITDELGGTATKVDIKWTAYASTNTTFEYSYTSDELGEGLHYYVVTEPN